MDNTLNLEAKVKVAIVLGALIESLPIKQLAGEDFENLLPIVDKIADEWANGVGSGIFKNNEEEGYVGAYATRVIKEQYGVREESECKIV